MEILWIFNEHFWCTRKSLLGLLIFLFLRLKLCSFILFVHLKYSEGEKKSRFFPYLKCLRVTFSFSSPSSQNLFIFLMKFSLSFWLRFIFFICCMKVFFCLLKFFSTCRLLKFKVENFISAFCCCLFAKKKMLFWHRKEFSIFQIFFNLNYFLLNKHVTIENFVTHFHSISWLSSHILLMYNFDFRI